MLFLVSDYIFEEKKRQVEIPNTPGYEKKMKYIEKMIAKVPDDIAEQYKLYGYRRDWLIGTGQTQKNHIGLLYQKTRYLMEADNFVCSIRMHNIRVHRKFFDKYDLIVA